MNKSVKSHIWMSSVTHMNTFCHIYDGFMSHIKASHMWYMWHTYMWHESKSYHTCESMGGGDRTQLRLPKFPTNFHGGPRNFQTCFHGESPKFVISFHGSIQESLSLRIVVLKTDQSGNPDILSLISSVSGNHVSPQTEEIRLQIITTSKISNKFSQESPYISNTFSRESPKFQKGVHVSKRSPCHSGVKMKRLPGNTTNSYLPVRGPSECEYPILGRYLEIQIL